MTVSIDNTNKEWKKGLAKHDLKGLKLFAGNGGVKSDFAEKYNIKSLTNYIVIDKKGNILSLSSSINEFTEIVSDRIE